MITKKLLKEVSVAAKKKGRFLLMCFHQHGAVDLRRFLKKDARGSGCNLLTNVYDVEFRFNTRRTLMEAINKIAKSYKRTVKMEVYKWVDFL